MPDEAKPAVARRLVLLFPGFEPMPVQAHMQRFVREARKTAPVYGMTLEAGKPVPAGPDDLAVGEIEFRASGEGWQTQTTAAFYGLDQLYTLYGERPRMRRLADGLGALADFVMTGTFFRFVKTSWRYGLFFLYPIGITLAILAAAAIATLAPVRLFGAWHLLWSIPLGLGTFWLAVTFAARRMHYLLVMDDWSCARDIARQARAELDGHLERMAADVRRRIEASDAEEVVFAAHSFGAVMAAMTLADALRHRTLRRRRAGLLTVGSSLLKVGLHPAAGQVRAAVGAVANGRVSWVDVQSRSDLIHFYGVNPVRALAGSWRRLAYTIRLRLEDQLSPQTHAEIRHDPFRVHRQFVFAAERRHAYSFHAILLGPERFRDVARRHGLAGDWRRRPGAAPEARG